MTHKWEDIKKTMEADERDIQRKLSELTKKVFGGETDNEILIDDIDYMIGESRGLIKREKAKCEDQERNLSGNIKLKKELRIKTVYLRERSYKLDQLDNHLSKLSIGLSSFSWRV